MPKFRPIGSIFYLLPLVLLAGASAMAQVRIVVAPGAVENGAYVNKSIGIAYRYPEGWLAVAEPGGDAGPLRVLLRAVPQPRDNSGAAQPNADPNANIKDHRQLTLYAVAQKDLPADQRQDPARFLATDPAAKQGKKQDARARTPLRSAQPLDVSSHPFVRAAYTLAAAHGEPALHEIDIAGVVNGHLLLLSAIGDTDAEAGELAESAVDLTFSPPADPEDAPAAPIIIEQRPDTVKRIRQSESVARARVLAQVEPEYPEEARDRGVQGEVLIAVVVGTDGNVAEATVLSGHPLLNDAALDAVKQWKFQPMLLDGIAVETETKIRMRFSLTSAKKKS